MIKVLFAALLLTTSVGAAVAADYDVAPQSRRYSSREVVADICHVRRCGPAYCTVINVCGCPDRYSCHGLYDHYGPWGGRRYLSAYTRYDRF
jgi:hypothetical protein